MSNIGAKLTSKPPDWQLPAGVSGGLWDYLHSSELAAGYDAYLGQAPVRRLDEALVSRLAKPGMSALDLGCGTGRTLVQLADLEVGQAVGVDLSPHMLAVAAQKCRPFGSRVTLLQENLVTLASLRPATFDLVLCLFSTLGLVQPAAARAQAVRRMAELLRPGGILLLHGHNRRHTLWQRGHRTWMLRDWWASFRSGHEAGNLLLPTHHGVAGLNMHLFTLGELRTLLRHAGLRMTQCSWVGDQPDGTLRLPWCFASWRAQGMLLTAVQSGS